MNKALNLLGLARKAGLAELGEEPVGAAARAGKAYLILVAGDASDHSWRRAKSFAAGTDQQCLRMRESKQELGAAVGRESLAMGAVTDPAMALALVQALAEPEAHKQVLEVLTRKTERRKQRQKEAKAHIRNVRKGKLR